MDHTLVCLLIFCLCSHITITGYQHEDPRSCLERWNSVVTNMDQVCAKVGREK